MSDSGHGELLGERAQLTGREPERVHTRLQDKLLGHVGVGIHRREAVGLASRPRARAQPEGVRGARVVDGGDADEGERSVTRGLLVRLQVGMGE